MLLARGEKIHIYRFKLNWGIPVNLGVAEKFHVYRFKLNWGISVNRHEYTRVDVGGVLHMSHHLIQSSEFAKVVTELKAEWLF